VELVKVQGASGVVSTLLRGAQLDSIRVYSLIVQLGFVRVGAEGNLPGEVWISISGALILEEDSSMAQESASLRDFFVRRAAVLGAVYRLVGREVTAAGVSASGALQVHFGGQCLRGEADDEVNLEEVWSVASDSPDTRAEHRWYVSLDDAGALSTRLPP
jgi:hypothetical protein